MKQDVPSALVVVTKDEGAFSDSDAPEVIDAASVIPRGVNWILAGCTQCELARFGDGGSEIIDLIPTGSGFAPVSQTTLPFLGTYWQARKIVPCFDQGDYVASTPKPVYQRMIAKIWKCISRKFKILLSFFLQNE